MLSGFLTDASTTPDNSENVLIEVLNNQRCFVTENGRSIYIKDYVNNWIDNSEPFEAEVLSYAVVDFDDDGENEIVASIKTDPRPNYVCLFVLHYDGQDVWGFMFGVRELHDLKTDGSFISTGGAGTHFYCRLSFENNQRNISYLAVKDDMGYRYEINGNICTVDEVDQYIREWESKEAVPWISFTEAGY